MNVVGGLKSDDLFSDTLLFLCARLGVELSKQFYVKGFFVGWSLLVSR